MRLRMTRAERESSTIRARLFIDSELMAQSQSLAGTGSPESGMRTAWR
jgi:hypothetical protein